MEQQQIFWRNLKFLRKYPQFYRVIWFWSVKYVIFSIECPFYTTREFFLFISTILNQHFIFWDCTFYCKNPNDSLIVHPSLKNSRHSKRIISWNWPVDYLSLTTWHSFFFIHLSHLFSIFNNLNLRPLAINWINFL